LSEVRASDGYAIDGLATADKAAKVSAARMSVCARFPVSPRVLRSISPPDEFTLREYKGQDGSQSVSD
jgi:hypothetical protein